MQIVPIIPQYKTGVKENIEVAGIAAMKVAKPVEERTLPPLLSYAHERPEQKYVEKDQHKENLMIRQEDRRLYCRRVHHQTMLEELRSSIDRRKHQLRNTDVQLHIDEEA